MKQQLRICACAFVLVASCSRPPTLDLGYTGSDDGLSAAHVAAEAWNQTCGLELVVVHRGAGDFAVTEQEGMTDGAYGETMLERPVLGVLGPKRATSIWFMSGDYAVSTLAHEFGHALGLGHAPSGVMKPGGEWEVLDPVTERRTLVPGAITAADCAAVSQRRD